MDLNLNESFLPILLVLAVQLFAIASTENYYTELETLTPPQRKALNTFKKSISPLLPHDYMKEDIYLVKFLQFNNFNIPKAERQIKEVLEWRRENNVDELLKNPPEYMKELNNQFPIYNDGFDKEGRPISEFWFGSWNVRSSALAGNLKNASLHMLVNGAERVTERLREQQAKGHNVTQWVLIINMDGFNVVDQVCPSCIPILASLATSNDKYFPNSSKGFWLINTPPQFNVLFRILRPVMSASTRAAMKTFGPDKKEWKPFLEKHIDLSQISDWYGGGKVRGNN